MNEDREQLVRELKAWRLNQPFMTSEEFQAQTARIQRNVRSRWPNLPYTSDESCSAGLTAREESSPPPTSSPE